MSIRPSESLKPLAGSLAGLLNSSGNCPETLVLMNKLGFFNDPASEKHEIDKQPAGKESDHKSSSGKIGIWKPDTDKDGRTSHIRTVSGYDASHWADIERIPPKSSKLRAVYLGESVARGFFFDPLYNPAMELENLLNKGSEGTGEKFEIVDLARSEMILDPMLDLARASLAMEPDFFVVFGGNNWVAPPRLWEELRLDISEEIRRTKSLQGAGRLIKNWLMQRTKYFIEAIAQAAMENGIPVFLIIPEFNLLDFETNTAQTAPYLPENGANANWVQVYESAVAAFENGKYDEAESLAKKLLEIDGGTTSAAFSVLAKCSYSKGLKEEAAKLFQKARDAEFWNLKHSVPKCLSIIQETMRTESRRYSGEITVIDLPLRFQEMLSGDIPDRRIFFDYCHLTLEGIHVAMSSTAEKILNKLEDRKTDWRELKSFCIQPDPGAITRAHLFAAMHNASWGQSEELVAYHCQRAAETDHQVELATLLSALAGRNVPSFMCSEYSKLVQSGDMTSIFRFEYLEVRMHHIFIDALADMFGKYNAELKKNVYNTRVNEHSVTLRRINLTDTPYSILSWIQLEAEHLEKFAFYKAHTRESRFVFVSDKASSVRIKLTFRVPGEFSEGGSVIVKINGLPVQKIASGQDWKTSVFTVEADCLKKGINNVLVRWPVQNGSGKEKLMKLADMLDAGALAREPVEFYPVFGEIASFFADSPEN